MNRETFEYKIQKTEGHWQPGYVESVLNGLGLDGWEAVGMGWMIAGSNGGGDAAVLLKRGILAPK
jgi:hypothetical protein